MKKILLFTLLLFTLLITACEQVVDEPDVVKCPVGQTLEDDDCVAIECEPGYVLRFNECLQVLSDPVDINPTYITYFSGVDNMNPHNETSDEAYLMNSFLMDTLYKEDYDWNKAIEIGLATEEGDFETSGADSLPYGRFPAMATSDPVDVNGDGRVWQFALREDLAFEDGTSIDADTFEYSWKQLLNPDLHNITAAYLYDELGLPLLNAEAYYNQNEDGEPSILWSQVGFSKIDQYTFQVSLNTPMNVWDIKGALLQSCLGVVHPTNYEAGMNEEKTQTTYGLIDNKLVSYGLYTLTEWADGQVFLFTRNDDHYASEDMRIKFIRYEVIEDQSEAVEEFKAGRLDYLEVTGEYYHEFVNAPNLRLSPITSFMRLALNIEGSYNHTANPLLQEVDFRKALYHAIDREYYTSNVRTPSHPTLGFLGPDYLSSNHSVFSYRGSLIGKSIFDDLYPEDYGYNAVEAKRLFDKAYLKLVNDGTITQGDTVSLEYKIYDVETGFQPNDWFKTSIEAIFNEGETFKKFELNIVKVSSQALNLAWNDGDFEMTFAGWTGLQYNAPSMLGQAYNSNQAYMLEKGFDTASELINIELPYTKAALESWVSDYESLTTTTELQDDIYNEWVDILLDFGNDDTLECTYDELYVFTSESLQNWYEGKDMEFDQITAAMETVLLEQMIAIPLFSSVTTDVYSMRVVLEANEYHPVMGWGGLKYMYIQAPSN